MKVFVEITAPVSAKFILAGFEDTVVADVLIRLHTNDAGVFKNINLTKETDYQQVPTFTVKNKHGNIFEPESADVAYLEERLVVIEGFISNIGVEYVDFSRIGRRWFKSESIYAAEETIFGYSTDHDKRPSPSRIINGDLLLQFFKMALKEKNDTASSALRFFQRGQAHFSNFRLPLQRKKQPTPSRLFSDE